MSGEVANTTSEGFFSEFICVIVSRMGSFACRGGYQIFIHSKNQHKVQCKESELLYFYQLENRDYEDDFSECYGEKVSIYKHWFYDE